MQDFYVARTFGSMFDADENPDTYHTSSWIHNRFKQIPFKASFRFKKFKCERRNRTHLS